MVGTCGGTFSCLRFYRTFSFFGKFSVPFVFVALWVIGFYGLFVFVALTNALLMRRAGTARQAEWQPAILIPARNEAENLPHLIPGLVAQGAKVYIYDDNSSDATAQVAAAAGAIVLRAQHEPPEGWTGKNHACHQLAKAALEDHSGDWMLFLDADTRPGPTFLASLGAVIAETRKPVVTGAGRLIPGAGLEPLYMSWVTWCIAATNPFGLVRLGGFGHNRFTNGQIVAWKKSTYFDLMPHETLRGEVLEDVKIGRLLAQNRIGVEVVAMPDVFATAMYRSTREAYDGMSKNSADIGGSFFGTVCFSLFLLTAAWLWVLGGWVPFALLIASKLLVDRFARTPWWTAPLLPLALTAGAVTCWRSLWLKSRGQRVWKGRTY